MNRTLIWLTFTGAFLWLCYKLEAAIAPFLIAFVIAYLIHPLVEKFDQKFHHKNLIISLIIALLTGGCISAIFVIMPAAYQQTALLASKAASYKSYLQPLITEKVNHLNPEIATHLSDALHASFNKIIGFIGGGINNIMNYVSATISTLVMFFIIPVILFYLLKDFTACKNSIEQNLPAPIKNKAMQTLSEINNLLSAYVRGQLKVCLIMATYYSISLSIVGLDLALLLGIISGFLIILPFIGFLISLCMSLIFSYIAFGFSYSTLAVALVYLFGALLEGTYLTPSIIGDKIGLHPLWIIFAVLAGGTLFGFVGMLFAIPVAGICKILLKRYLASEIIPTSILDLKNKDK